VKWGFDNRTPKIVWIFVRLLDSDFSMDVCDDLRLVHSIYFHCLMVSALIHFVTTTAWSILTLLRRCYAFYRVWIPWFSIIWWLFEFVNYSYSAVDLYFNGCDVCELKTLYISRICSLNNIYGAYLGLHIILLYFFHMGWLITKMRCIFMVLYILWFFPIKPWKGGFGDFFFKFKWL